MQPWTARVRPRVFCPQTTKNRINVKKKTAINIENESNLPLLECQPSPVLAVSVCLALSSDFIGDDHNDVRLSCSSSLLFVELTSVTKLLEATFFGYLLFL